MIRTNDTPTVAVHRQSLGDADTANVPSPSFAAKTADSGETPNAHGEESCETVTGWLPTVKVALRGDGPFAAALKRTDPFPVPMAPDVMVSQLAFDVADQAHELPVVTDTVSEPPVAENVTLVLFSVNVHGGGAVTRIGWVALRSLNVARMSVLPGPSAITRPLCPDSIEATPTLDEVH